LPQVHVYKDGTAVDKVIGLQSKARLLEIINKHL